MYKSETPVQDAVLGDKPVNWGILLCIVLMPFVNAILGESFIGKTIMYALAGMGLYVWLLIIYQLARMVKNSKKRR